jgi:hypothetical protein
MGSRTAAALSGPTREVPLMPTAEAFSATTGAPGRRSATVRLAGSARGDRQPGNALHRHLLHMPALSRQRVLRVQDEQGRSGLGRNLLGAAQHLEEERIGEIAHHKAVGRRAPPAQRQVTRKVVFPGQLQAGVTRPDLGGLSA